MNLVVSENKQRFVTVYHGVTTNSQRSNSFLTDVYLYCFMKTKMDKTTKTCKLSLNFISSITKLSKATISLSLNRLKDLGYINFEAKPNVTTVYTFIHTIEHFEKIPLYVIYYKELTISEKGFLISLLRLCFRDVEQYLGKATFYDIKKISEELNISYNSVKVHINSLKEKNFIMQTSMNPENKNSMKCYVLRHETLLDSLYNNLMEDHNKEIQEYISQLKEKDVQIKARRLDISKLSQSELHEIADRILEQVHRNSINS